MTVFRTATIADRLFLVACIAWALIAIPLGKETYYRISKEIRSELITFVTGYIIMLYPLIFISAYRYVKGQLEFRKLASAYTVVSTFIVACATSAIFENLYRPFFEESNLSMIAASVVLSIIASRQSDQ